MRAVKMRIYGLVQGVGYRYYTYRLAKRYGVKGYVMNMPDGSVEVHAECEDEKKLQDFLSEAARGPATAVVNNIETEEVNPEGYKSFEIEYHGSRW
ncbi:MAG: acylphosphatase [Thermotogaceae bacterium]|nr:acylphosphatase [Thermotogaceae bacterium]